MVPVPLERASSLFSGSRTHNRTTSSLQDVLFPAPSSSVYRTFFQLLISSFIQDRVWMCLVKLPLWNCLLQNNRCSSDEFDETHIFYRRVINSENQFLRNSLLNMGARKNDRRRYKKVFLKNLENLENLENLKILENLENSWKSWKFWNSWKS